MSSVVPVLWALATGPVVALLLLLPAGAWWALLGYQAGCFLGALLGAGTLGTRPALAPLGLLAAVSAVAALALGVAAIALGLRPESPEIWAAWGIEPPGDRALLFLYVLCNPWCEEWFWRGTLLHGATRRRLGGRGALALAVLGFLPFHAIFLTRSFGAGLGVLGTLGVLAAALFWTCARERSGNTWWAVASHLGADLGVAGLYFWFLRIPT